MKNRLPKALLLAACCLLHVSFSAFSQLPSQQWSNTYGGSAVDVPFTIKPTADGGTIVAGYTTSKDEDVSNVAAREYWDVWIVKLDACGNILWQQTFGGKGYESARDILQTSDGGFLVLAETNSTDGGVISGYGGTKDIWLLRITAQGDLQWQKRIGGNGLDIGNHLYSLEDGNYLIAATTSSNDGDVSANHSGAGYTDGWLVKIDPSGNILWSRCFGGTKNEELLDIEVIDSRIYVAGYANSVDGDIPANQKNYDVWLLITDLAGTKISSNIYGGSQNDVAYSMTRGSDGTLTLAGYTTSSDGDVSVNKGSQDYWVLNLTTTGSLNWQKTFGGTEADYANYVFTDADGGYVVGGVSYSRDGDVVNAAENGDFWMVKLDADGNHLWSDAAGGSGNDFLRAMTYVPARKEYYVAGDSESDDGDFDENEGVTDFALIKFKVLDSITVDTMVCDVAAFSSTQRIVADVCGYDSLLIAYRPVPAADPFGVPVHRDTIFSGGNITLPSVNVGTITWSPHPTLSCSNCSSPVASPQVTTTYPAQLQLNGCTIPGQFTVVVLEDAVVHFPNAFTPNGDGRNDLFGPAGKVPAGYSMQIFNRYGEIVFVSTSITNRWDGRVRGKMMESNTFVYLATYTDMNKQQQVKKGTVTLIR